ncbi:MAG TPA: arylsulfotransferase family protein [Solirubrobacteraceae bacterium]|nr:arylsulfotransferase family protein [Solirubrobacteraceae bacterium]
MGRHRQRRHRRRATQFVVLLGAACTAAALSSCGGDTPTTGVALGDQAALAAAAANPVTVSPLPGTPDASPATQISFLGGPGTTVSDVRVVGSRSGVHGGHLEAYSTGTGQSFLPSRPFVPGERVTVHASAGGERLSTTFTVAHQAPVDEREFPLNPGDPNAIQHYASAPTLTPSSLRITTPARPGAAPGDLFLAPYQAKGSPGPMISEQDGALVWFHPLPAGYESTNFQVQQYEGKPMLTWWQGRIIRVGFGQGEDEIYNSSYQHVATVRAGNGYHADLHEIRLTPAGTAWIDAFDPVYRNLSSVHGSAHGILTDSVIEEIDVKTGLVMWEWHALGHIPLRDSLNAVPGDSYPWDYVHINSISPAPGGAESGQPGEILLSARNTWTLYYVNMHTGGFEWLFGDGRRSTLRLGRGVRFYWQHDAELQPGGLISVFNNASTPPKERESSGLVMRPDLSNHTVSLVKRFANPTKTLLAAAQGNTLSLPGGDWLMGYGELPNFTEYDSAGHVLLDGTLGLGVQDFRTYLSPWSGQPTTPPAIAVQGSPGAATVQASWNGATDVASWQVLAGASAETMTPVASAPRRGFQTAIPVSAAGPEVAVRALGAGGQVLGTSAAVSMP